MAENTVFTVEGGMPVKMRSTSGSTLTNRITSDNRTVSGKKAQSFTVRQLTLVYVLLLSALCLATTLYFAVTRVPGNRPEFYEVLFTILFIMSIIIFIYLFVYIKKRKHAVQKTNQVRLEIDIIGNRLSSSDPAKVGVHHDPFFHFDGEGFNLYLRLGLILFTVFGVIYNIFRIIGEMRDFQKCGNASYVLFCLLQSAFICLQTAFILINHKIIFLSDKPLIRFFLSHLLMVNICLWIHSGIGEISKSVKEVLNEARNETDACDQSKSAEALVRPFMLPALIEYSLLGAPMIYEILQQIGNEESDSKKEEEKPYPPLHKAKRGGGFGLIAVIVCILSILCFYLLRGSAAVAGLTIYHIEDTVFNVLAIVFGILVYHRLRPLKFKRHTEGKVDENILWLALFGTIIYHVIILSKSIDALSVSRGMNSTTRGFIGLEIMMSLLTIISCSFQTVVIICAMHKVPEFNIHIDNKPGRPYITFLLFINFCLWILDTFETKKSELAFSVTAHPSLHPNKGIDVTTAVTLLHVALPLNILFRFHSSICLSCVWTRSYSIE